nr:GDSL-type esterase/lipase family protein [Nocardiopsis mwathae]
MVVGDSIAQGSSGDYTWRYRLWKHLDEDVGADVAFVGPYNGVLDLGGDGGGPGYADPDFDQRHAAVWGAQVKRLEEDIGEQVAEYEPHYLLLMAGINDFVNGGTAPQALEDVRDLVRTARVADGDLQVVLGEITPVRGTPDDERLNAQVAEFNMALPRVAEDMTGEDSPVVVARTSDGYSAADDNWDTTHPNARGELKIAAAFADALAGPLRLGAPYPRPLPDVPVGPQTRPKVSVAGQEGDRVVLSWDPVPGATRYQVLQRRLRPDPDEQVVLPTEVMQPGEGPVTTEVDHLLSGATYEFVVRPFKGHDGGRRSRTVTAAVVDDPPPAPRWVRIDEERTHLVWAAVPDATHFEVWRRPLRCAEPSGGAGGSAAAECEPLDDEGPGDGEGWTSAGVVSGDRRWAVDTGGARGAEFVVVSHRHYLPGEAAAPVEFAEED